MSTSIYLASATNSFMKSSGSSHRPISTIAPIRNSAEARLESPALLHSQCQTLSHFPQSLGPFFNPQRPHQDVPSPTPPDQDECNGLFANWAGTPVSRGHNGQSH